MKKSVKIIIIVLSIIAIIAIGIGVFAIVNVLKAKDPISAEEFKEKMEAKGFVITDANNQFAEYDNYINQVYIAYDYDDDYQIEFYDLQTEEKAEKFYEGNKSTFEEEKDISGKKMETDSHGTNSAKYTLTTGGEYMVVSRIDNTVIYLRVDEEDKQEVQDLLKELEY